MWCHVLHTPFLIRSQNTKKMTQHTLGFLLRPQCPGKRFLISRMLSKAEKCNNTTMNDTPKDVSQWDLFSLWHIPAHKLSKLARQPHSLTLRNITILRRDWIFPLLHNKALSCFPCHVASLWLMKRCCAQQLWHYKPTGFNERNRKFTESCNKYSYIWPCRKFSKYNDNHVWLHENISK